MVLGSSDSKILHIVAIVHEMHSTEEIFKNTTPLIKYQVVVNLLNNYVQSHFKFFLLPNLILVKNTCIRKYHFSVFLIGINSPRLFL